MSSSDDEPVALGYAVQKIHIGVISSQHADDLSTMVAQKLRRLLPDRIRTHLLSETIDWPNRIDLLIICCSGGLSKETAEWIQTSLKDRSHNVLVWTDFDLDRNLEDRQNFYDTLVVGGLSKLVPRRVLLTPGEVDVFGRKLLDPADAPEHSTTSASTSTFLDRQDQLEIDGVILLKPILERPLDPSDPTVTIYYPRSQGGGAKTLQFLDDKEMNVPNFTAHFDPNVRHVPQETSHPILYEELFLPDQEEETADGGSIVRRKERKRDRFKKFMKKLSGANDTNQSHFGDDDQISHESDLSRMDRKIFVVTTASLPWMTGTAVNPLLRVACLKRGRPKKSVTLVIPWLSREKDRDAVYGHKHKFQKQEEQEAFVREWLRNEANMPEEADPETGIQIMWYPSKYYSALGSIFPSGDICGQIPKEDADFCILEEPEHLNWIRVAEEEGEIWTDKFNHVVGVIHTNYRAYASATAAIAAPVISGLSSLMVRAYCDKVIKLSATLQEYSPEKEVVCNVHGVRSDFLNIGKERATAAPVSPTNTNIAVDAGDGEEKPVAYFIGKLLWEKGLDRLLRLQYFYKEITGEFFPIDIVGDGPDKTEIEATYLGLDVTSIRKTLANANNDDTGSTTKFSWGAMTEQLGSVLEVPTALQVQTGKIPGQFHGRQDHGQFCSDYKVIVNPSVTEVLCTTTAEALAMGKFAIIPKHPSNDFFLQFPNCLAYKNKVEFVTKLVHALTHDPAPLTDELAYIFSWDAATERLIQSSAITMKEARLRAKARKGHEDDRIAKMYNKLGIRGHAWGVLLGSERESTIEKKKVKSEKEEATGSDEQKQEEAAEEEEEQEGSGPAADDGLSGLLKW